MYKNFKEMAKELFKNINKPFKEGQFTDDSFDLWLNEQHKKAYEDDNNSKLINERRNYKMINALDIKEFLEQYNDDELKSMKVHIENISFDDIILERGDSFKCDNIAISKDDKTLILEF